LLNLKTFFVLQKI